MSSILKNPSVVDYANGGGGFTRNVVATTTKIQENEEILRYTNGTQYINKNISGKTAVVQITSAQLLALHATPITVVPAPGAGWYNHVNKWSVRHDAGITPYTIPTGANLSLKYTNASGVVAATVINSTGFIDQITAQIKSANGLAGNAAAPTTSGDFTPVDNAPIVLNTLTAELTAGNFPIYLFIEYDLIPTDYIA